MTALRQTFRMAIFDEFLDALAQIPRAQQKKVNKFLRRFREDPTSASINYESINTFSDPNLRTVRIDQAYRAIVLKPETGNVYVMLWVDHHDKAMRWAENRKVAIHPETGCLQVISGVTVQTAALAQAPETPPLFSSLRDRELRRLGVPEDQLPLVQALQTMAQLEEMSQALPPEAFEALYWLGEGESLEEVEKAMAVSAEASVDTTDFETALDRAASKRRFVVVDDDLALEAMLDAPLEKWRIFLHPSQRQLVHRTWNGPVRVLGGAGTGKSVVAIHRAAYLVEKVFTQPGDRILFTTFTGNLAADTRAKLAGLCSPEAMARIEVVHLDRWVSDLLRRAGYRYQIKYWGLGSTLEKLWEKALALGSEDDGFKDAFFRDEWELVVQRHGCETWEDYKRANRSGRGVRMSRKQRRAIWPIFEEYRHLLEKHAFREPEDALRDAAALLEQEKVRVTLRSIVVDEAQDMSTHAFALLRAVIPEVPNDLFIVGDGHQRIYRKRVVLSHAGVNIRGRGRRLRINYRTTDEIRRYAVALLEGVDFDNLDAGTDSTRGYRSLMHGEAPEVLVRETFPAEVEAIAEWLTGAELSRACLVARTNKLVARYAEALEDRGIATRRVLRREADDPSQPGLRVATMHRIKGLEYNRMIIAGMSEYSMPLKVLVDRSGDAAVRRETELMERALLYVALTRARTAALVTAHGKISKWVEKVAR